MKIQIRLEVTVGDRKIGLEIRESTTAWQHQLGWAVSPDSLIAALQSASNLAGDMTPVQPWKDLDQAKAHAMELQRLCAEAVDAVRRDS